MKKCRLVALTAILLLGLSAPVTPQDRPSRTTTHSAETPISFPGDRASARSPSGRFEVRLEKKVEPGAWPVRDLVLFDRTTKSRQHLTTVYRSAGIMWRPGSEGVLVNDYADSNFSDCLIALPGKALVSVDDLLIKADRFGIPQSPDDSHYYVTCDGWDGADHVKVRLDGHRDAPGGDNFSYDFALDIPSMTLSRK